MRREKFFKIFTGLVTENERSERSERGRMERKEKLLCYSFAWN